MAQPTEPVGQAGLSCNCCSGPPRPQETQTILADNPQTGYNSDAPAFDDGASVDSCCKVNTKGQCTASIHSAAPQDCGSCCDKDTKSCCAAGPAGCCVDTENKSCKASIPASDNKCQSGCCDSNPKCNTPQPGTCESRCCQAIENPKGCYESPGRCASTDNEKCDQGSSCTEQQQFADDNCCSTSQANAPPATSTLDICCTDSNECECSGTVLDTILLNSNKLLTSSQMSVSLNMQQSYAQMNRLEDQTHVVRTRSLTTVPNAALAFSRVKSILKWLQLLPHPYRMNQKKTRSKPLKRGMSQISAV